MGTVICDLYCRVSTTEQAKEGYSIGEQEERLRKYAEAQGWIINDVCIDPGFSGASLLRPGIQKVIDDANAGRINKVVVYKIDRLSRSQKDTLFLIEDVFIKNGVDFVSMTESLDTSSAFGMAMVGILSVFAQLERETIKERMMLGKDARVKSGKYHGHAHDVIGYKYENGTLTIDEYDAAIVHSLFEEYVGGETLTGLTRKLDIMHFRGSTSWQPMKIRRILTQPLYIGRQRWKGETVEVESCPRFISDELWETAQRELARRNSPQPQKQTQYKHVTLLGGMLWCGCCGARYAGVPTTVYKGKSYTYYCYNRIQYNHHKVDHKCENRSWKVNELNEIIIEEIKDLRAARAAGVYTDPVEEEPQYVKERRAYEKRLADLQKQQDRLIDLYALGSIDADAINRRSEVLKAEQAAVQKRLESLALPEGVIPHAEVDAVLDECMKVLKTTGPESYYMELYPLVHKLIQAVTLTGDEIHIKWNFEA